MSFVDPPWLSAMPEDQQKENRCRFLLKLAALYYSESGKVNCLSEALGFHAGSLHATANISPELAIRLEGMLGKDLFPRQLFRPDIFLVQE